MKKKMKLSYKAVLSLMLSAVLFCMPAVGFAMNGNYATEVHAEDSIGESETATEQETESTTESSTEPETESTVSGNDVPEPVCTCEDKCSSYGYDHTCEVCAGDYKKCAYKKPNVTTILQKSAFLYLMWHTQAILRLPVYRQESGRMEAGWM